MAAHTLQVALAALPPRPAPTAVHLYQLLPGVPSRNAAAAAQIDHTGFLGVAEMLGWLDLHGSKIIEFPTTLEVRMIGRSKMKIGRTIIAHLGLLTRLALSRLQLDPTLTSAVKPGLVPVAGPGGAPLVGPAAGPVVGTPVGGPPVGGPPAGPTR